ncbi:fungal-specific transcription factor domain-containing protein [Aspergillus karnatakaensis]|uniref:putative C6 transcription factor n=1 Tax=Aspergillus karnatakaensis TaxID=1810916 RepID=UPI003CCD65E3
MRSSIACARCRRSKIKCVNSGIDTTCRACESSGRDCVYPTPAIGAGGAAKRDIAALADGEDRNGDWDSPKRQRSRKAIGLSSGAAKDASKGSLDALDPSLLTVKVWDTVFDLFQSHFATLLPFLHPASFMGQTRQLSGSRSSPSVTTTSNPQEAPRDQVPTPAASKVEPNPLIPLGVLALTARFHPQLAAYHSPSSPGNPTNPLAASEFYATALRSRLAGVDGASLAAPDLTRVQALLMLALHEWGMCRGKNAWLYVGMAIRLSQAMGLPFELENDVYSRDVPAFKTEADMFGILRRSEQKEQTSDDVIAQETKRRTFWACFILDRCLSSGKYRPRMIRVKELGIQLPSDNAFAFGERVRTSRLSDPVGRRPQSFGSQGVQIPSIRQSIGGFGDEKLIPNGSDNRPWSPVSSRRKDSAEDEIDRWEIGAEESVLSRVIRVIRVWGSIAKWSCAGGRRTEQLPPWHADSRFSRLRTLLVEFRDGLSRNLQYSPRNTDTHIMYKNNLPPYTIMHVVYFLSVIILHRAYIPFLPVRCTEPVGPLDEPVDKSGMPDSFWRDSARELFAAARQLIDLVVTCQERGVLAENPLVGFAIYNASFVGVYAAHFPHMDLDGALAPVYRSDPHSQGLAQSRKALDILREMRPRLKMAAGWFRTLNRLHSYFSKVKRDFRRNSRRSDMLPPDAIDPHSNGIRPVREGGAGGGLEEFKLLEKLFLEFGSIDDQLPEGQGHEEDGDRATNISDAGSNHVRSDPGDLGDGQFDGAAGRRESWVPVNSPGLPLPGPDGERRPSLPLPSSRSLQSQSPFSLPSIQHHPDGPLYNSASPTLPSLAPSSAYGGLPTTSVPASSTRLQPLNSWLSRSQPPPPASYSQALPPISATAPAHHLPMLPPPGSVGHPGASPPATLDGYDSYNSLWATSLGGDDVLAFLEGSEYAQSPGMLPSEVGVPAGWLSTVWAEFTR